MGFAALALEDFAGARTETFVVVLRADALVVFVLGAVVFEVAAFDAVVLVDFVAVDAFVAGFSVVLLALDERAGVFDCEASAALPLAALLVEARLVVPRLACVVLAVRPLEDVLSPVCAIARSFPYVPPAKVAVAAKPGLRPCCLNASFTML
ncbi:MAG: hypothetical protein RIC24_10345 [Hyphomicrobiales bacterium]|jgi:hypothetical protein